MVLSIGSTPLIRMPFRAAPIHIQAVFIEAFHLQAVCRLELCLSAVSAVGPDTNPTATFDGAARGIVCSPSRKTPNIE